MPSEEQSEASKAADEDGQKLKELFKKLDVNQDGRIDIDDLTSALDTMNVPQVPDHAQKEYAQKLFLKYDKDKDGEIDFSEFVNYVREHEQHLKLYFKKIDTNEDGTIDVSEIRESFRKLGVHIDTAEAEKLLMRMDKDGTLKIDWNEWREFLLLTPGQSLKDILHYWRHSSIIDIGENSLVPDDFTEKELQTGMWWRHLVAGGAAGAVSRTATAPLDRLKILLQVHGSRKNISIKSGFQHMLKEGGYMSMWRGNGINVIKIAPESALKFMAYEQIKTWIKGDSNRDIHVFERLLSGSAAGAISQTIIYPMEVLKTRLALRKTGQYNGVFDCTMKIFKHEGAKAFYKGYIPNLLGIIPYAGIDLAIYETLKKSYSARNKNKDPGIFVLLACGTTSSTCGQLASYPLALVRTRLQAQAKADVKGGIPDNMTGLFRTIIREEGPRGLYRGITPNFMKVAPAVSISYVVYEQVRKALGVSMT
ncbi:calcium-binding mitochondrial carrier protein SCaMC-2-like isoform X1 [Haliotis rufescens]|uniref:calcium-binding mitochondrial carrier protein SCaMC-2-like isoform X1 n=1 Tax=Haliotis rufescens TaxID=6454 RepID=UPI001EB07544|nr:calcium-binding mitochondrial carrier protein SCaMC-2-like isoform X1 [Haliotis rufescens]